MNQVQSPIGQPLVKMRAYKLDNPEIPGLRSPEVSIWYMNLCMHTVRTIMKATSKWRKYHIVHISETSNRANLSENLLQVQLDQCPGVCKKKLVIITFSLLEHSPAQISLTTLSTERNSDRSVIIFSLCVIFNSFLTHGEVARALFREALDHWLKDLQPIQISQ